ncbi:hypothetical protein KBC31_04150 [Candidatus Saccharibacteria bacterium]|jgi:hypothetical protein|nr:hypothetical protein [Candidatus Saccharibacteria bacterium]
MIDLKTVFGLLSVFLGFVGISSYALSVVKGQTHPHIYSWILYTILSGSSSFMMIANGAGAGAWANVLSFITNFAVVGLALRYNMARIRRVDTFLLIISFATIGLWAFTQSIIFVVIQALLVLLASLPTIRKILQNDGPERLSLYYLNICKHAFSFLALATLSFDSIILLLAALIINFLIIGTSILVQKNYIQSTVS